MIECENEVCHKMHDGSFGSGKFCCRSCANRRPPNKEKNKKISDKLKGDVRCGWNKGKKYQQKNKKQKTFVIKRCEYCLICFEQNSQKQRFCSTFCSNKIVNITSYSNGRKVSGGKCKWYKFKNFKVQGTYELRTCKILESWKNNKKILYWEYTNDRISYLGADKKNHKYLLDFKVIDLDGNVFYIETKGYITEKDRLKWNSAKEQRINLEIWMLCDIEKNERSCSSGE